jgi:hypothetical protein
VSDSLALFALEDQIKHGGEQSGAREANNHCLPRRLPSPSFLPAPPRLSEVFPSDDYPTGTYTASRLKILKTCAHQYTYFAVNKDAEPENVGAASKDGGIVSYDIRADL